MMPDFRLNAPRAEAFNEAKPFQSTNSAVTQRIRAVSQAAMAVLFDAREDLILVRAGK
jgi:hypothetical protein